MRFHPRHLVAREFILNHDLRPGAHAADLFGKLVVVELQRVGDGGKMLPFQLIAIQQQRIRSLVVDDDAAVAIENLAAGRENRRRFDAVPLGSLASTGPDSGPGVPRKPEIRKINSGDDEVLENRDLASRCFRAVAQYLVGRNLFALPLTFN